LVFDGCCKTRQLERQGWVVRAPAQVVDVLGVARLPSLAERSVQTPGANPARPTRGR
jgi:hypothetical protein